MTQAPMPLIDVNGRRIHYQTEGDGPPVMLLHNATGSIRDWRYLMPRLAEEGYRAIAYDRPGFGRSAPVESWPLDYLHHDREDLIALMDALGLEDTALLGNSDGATISLLTAAAHPQRVALVVAESPHLWYEKESLAAGFQHFQETLAQDPRFIKTMRQAHRDQAEQVLRRWRERWRDPAFFNWNERDALSYITCPVLVIHGGQDIFFPISHSQTIANGLRESKFLLLPNVGHTPHLERPDEYAHHVITFLDTIKREHIDYIHNEQPGTAPLSRTHW